MTPRRNFWHNAAVLDVNIHATGHGVRQQLVAVLHNANCRFITARDAVQLSVFSENFRAQRFYQRHGFVKVADIDFWVGNHRDDEFLYELAL